MGWGNNVHVNLNTHGLYGVHMGVGLGWGGGNNVHVDLNTHGLYGVHMGVGVITFMLT